MEQIKIEDSASYDTKKVNPINCEIKTNLDIKDSKLNINKE